MLGYKVVRRRTGDGPVRLVSARIDTGQAVYVEGLWVEPLPGCGPLTVFGSAVPVSNVSALKEARTFAGMIPPVFEVWLCQYEECSTDTVYTRPAAPEYRRPAALSELRLDWPHTCLAGKVKLISRIE